MKLEECFKIKICKSDDLLNSENWQTVKEIKCEAFGFFREPTTIVADPFLFVKDDTLYLFYENKKMYHNGVISMTKTVDLVHWSAPITVLEEQCHLSYPWVFEENGHTYMIPETCGLNSIRLYEGNENLTDFKFVKTLLVDDVGYDDGFSFSDSSFYIKDGIYYLMTTVNDGTNNILKLFVSNKIDGKYSEHPQSPVCSDNKYGRNAGSLFEYNGKLYRVAQDCEKRYGDNVNLLEVEKLDPYKYEEQVVRDNMICRDIPFYKEGGHQFNVVKFKDKYIIATDAKEYHSFIIPRILHKLGLHSSAVM